MLIIKNSEQFLNVLFVGNVKRKKFRGQVVIPDESFGVVEVDYLFDMPNHFVFCIPGNEDSKIVVSKSIATFAVGNLVKSLAYETMVEPVEIIQEFTHKKSRKASKKEND